MERLAAIGTNGRFFVVECLEFIISDSDLVDGCVGRVFYERFSFDMNVRRQWIFQHCLFAYVDLLLRGLPTPDNQWFITFRRNSRSYFLPLNRVNRITAFKSFQTALFVEFYES